MNLHHVKRMAGGYKTLVSLFDWKQLYAYLGEGINLEQMVISSDQPNQTVLILAPHPDDEVFGCGGTLAFHRRRGDVVHVIYLTDGSRGTASGRQDKSLIAQREQEVRAGLQVLGDAETQFWRFSDGSFRINKTSTGLLKGQLETIRPDVVYVPWFGDDHPDHRVVVPLMVEALSLLKVKHRCEIRQYEVWTPLIPNRIVLIGDVIEEKIRAMEAHQSQLGNRIYRDGILGLNAYRGAMAAFSEPAEAFLVLSQDRFMHFYTELMKLP